VMYAGRVVESGTTAEIFAHPRHPYTLGLLESIPRADEPVERRLRSIPGSPPTGYERASGCSFAPRCAYALERCRIEEPILEEVDRSGDSHLAACFVDVDARRGSPP
jgi:oligopeptide/dipeptide ABC transporter ATP-binding protein